jgi:hypothetical protein
MRILCWKTIHTLKLSNTGCFPLQKLLRQRSSILRCSHIAYIVTISLCNHALIAGFEFLTAKKINFQIFWDMTGNMSD